MLDWLLETCFLCFLCCTNNRGNIFEFLFCSYCSTEILVLILLSEGLRSALLMPQQMWYLRIMTRCSGLREPIAAQLIFGSDHGTFFMLGIVHCFICWLIHLLIRQNNCSILHLCKNGKCPIPEQDVSSDLLESELFHCVTDGQKQSSGNHSDVPADNRGCLWFFLYFTLFDNLEIQ